MVFRTRATAANRFCPLSLTVDHFSMAAAPASVPIDAKPLCVFGDLRGEDEFGKFRSTQLPRAKRFPVVGELIAFHDRLPK